MEEAGQWKLYRGSLGTARQRMVRYNDAGLTAIVAKMTSGIPKGRSTFSQESIRYD